MRLLLTTWTLLIICGCSTVHKSSQSTSKQTTSIDTSSQSSRYVKETTVTEKATAPVVTIPDSIQHTGYLAVADTIGYFQAIQTDKLSLDTYIKPIVKDGKIAGYNINSKAIAKSQTVQAPVDRVTSTKERRKEEQKAGKTDTKIESSKIAIKQAWCPSVGVVIGGIIVLLVGLIGFGIYKHFFK